MGFPRLPRAPVFLLLLILVLSLTGCGDDPTGPENFRVVIVVKDPSGAPVPGLDLSVVPDTPFYQDGLKIPGYRPAVVIPIVLQRESQARVAIEDIEGTEVRVLGEDVFPQGVHHWVWNGLDDVGDRLASGVYRAHLEVRDPETGDLLYEHRRDMLMAILDPARYSAGTTDSQGRIVLTDRRLFPYLYDQPSIPAANENGELIGNIEFTPLMRFYLADLTGGGGQRRDEEITGSAEISVTWVVRGPGSPPSMEQEMVPEQEKLIPPAPTELGQPFPCPFN